MPTESVSGSAISLLQALLDALGLLLTLPHRLTADVGILACAGGTQVGLNHAQGGQPGAVLRDGTRCRMPGHGRLCIPSRTRRCCRSERCGWRRRVIGVSSGWPPRQRRRGSPGPWAPHLVFRAGEPHDHVAASRASVTSLPSCSSVLARRASLTGSVQLSQDERTILNDRDPRRPHLLARVAGTAVA